MTGCFFSVIIPAYNYGHFLARAVDSVLGQGFSDCEVIVINDGSTDNTDALMQDVLKKNDPRVRYIKQENKGQSAVRNLGIRQSRGSYLLFLDADDALLPQSLEGIYRYLTVKPQTDVLICDYLAQMPNGKKKLRSNRALKNQEQQWFFYFINNDMAMANGATIIRRSVFDRVQYCEGLRQAEDIPVFGLMLANFTCALFLMPVLQNFKHVESMRNQIKYTPQIAQQLTDLLFNPEKLPNHLMLHRGGFLANQYFQLSRSYEKAKQYKLAIHCYHRSLIINPNLIVKLGRHVKYLRCVIKSLVG